MTEKAARINRVIRPVRLEDAAALVTLAHQLGYPSTPSQIAARLTRILGDPAQVLYAAEADGRAIGWVQAADVQTLASDRSVEIRGLVVDQEHRGTGAGRALMEQVEWWARDRGCERVTLRSNVLREQAHAFYRRLGYTILKTQHAFLKVLS